MKLFPRIRARYRQWRRRRAYSKTKAKLREFVYLDEVSVYSLIASKLGPIATEFTDTQTISLQGESEGSVGGSLNAGVGSVETDVIARILSSRTNSTQVLRKSIVQTQFRDLYDYEVNSLVMRPVSKEADGDSPNVYNLGDLVAATTEPATRWIIDPDELARGRLLEIEIQLEAEAIFRVSTVLSSLLEILEEDLGMFRTVSYESLNQVKVINRILGKLLVGLVPIQAQAVNYCVVELEGKEWIVHRRLLKECPDTNALRIYPLFVAGVAEHSLFWKDIRRVLFSKARFRALCRVAQNGLQDSWTPVKLADVLRSVDPSLSDQINDLGSITLEAISNASATGQSEEPKQQRMHDALINYADLLAKHYSRSLTVEDSSEVERLALQHCTLYDSVEGRRVAFEAISRFLFGRFDIEREPLIVAQFREDALAGVGIDSTGQTVPLAVLDVASSIDVLGTTSSDSEKRFLDSEFVAIYW